MYLKLKCIYSHIYFGFEYRIHVFLFLAIALPENHISLLKNAKDVSHGLNIFIGARLNDNNYSLAFTWMAINGSSAELLIVKRAEPELLTVTCTPVQRVPSFCPEITSQYVPAGSPVFRVESMLLQE